MLTFLTGNPFLAAFLVVSLINWGNRGISLNFAINDISEHEHQLAEQQVVCDTLIQIAACCALMPTLNK
jgi:hypothetical protein